ncbi:hypothetical protein [Euzebya tangerina]|uniref:hypothetical protein n=1 Tax=Euzebya tangerina TaxID=591198 RepID=UPI000E31B742|nr:hypothetical protein [Euzebya tangerina]
MSHDPEADRRTTGRAIRAGLWSAGVLSVLTVIGNLAFGGDGQTAMVWVLSSVVVGTLVTAGWLILSVILDLLAGEVPGRGRLIPAGIAFAVAFVSPILPAAMLQVIAEQ